MSEMTIPELAALDVKGYATQTKARLRNNVAWLDLLDPTLVERTRWTLDRMVASIDDQKSRVEKLGTADAAWLSSVNSLRRYAKQRLDAIPPSESRFTSSTRESRAWRAFSAALAIALDEGDPTALDRIQAPYGGLTARQWLVARETKREVAR